MQTNHGKVFASLVTSASMLALATPAMAQDDDNDGSIRDDNVIIVTAQKREQNLQDVPISITAFAGEQLEAARLEGVEDIGRLTPGVYVTPNPADNNGVRINIRGIGTFDPQIGQDSRIAIYQDGVYLGKTQGLAFDLPDLERVEILKGPQGTLYGRNAVGGAVNLISKRPEGGEFSGEVTGEYGRFDHRKVSAAVNVPLGDLAAWRFSGVYRAQDGWIQNDGPGVDFGGGEQYAFKAAFGIDAAPNLRIDMSADFSDSEQQPLFYQSLPGTANPGSLFAAAVGTSDGRQRQVTTSFANETGDNEQYGGNITVEWDFADNHSLKLIGAHRRLDSSRFVTLVPTANPAFLFGTLNADIIPDTQVPGVQSFNSLLGGTELAFQLAGQPLRPDFGDAFTRGLSPQTGLFLSPAGGGPTIEGHKQTSFEATLTGDFSDGRVRYTVGAFYYDEFTSSGFADEGNFFDVNSYLFVLAGFNPAINTPVINAALTAPALAPTLTNPFVPQAVKDMLIAQNLTPFVGDVNAAQVNPASLVSLYGEARQSAANDLRIDTKAFALYGEVTFDITEALSITAGLRYSDESKDGFGQPKSPFFLDNVDLLGQVIDPNVGDIDFDVLNPSFVLTYEPNDDFLLYASYKESFRSGGFNAAAVGPRLPGETFGADFLFGREDIAAYEVGAKTALANGAIQLNAAGFYYDITNQQTTVALDPLIATSRAVVNTDEQVWGFELDAQWFISNVFSLNGSYSWIDGDAGDVTNPLTNQIEVRDELQGTPEHSFRVGFNFDGDLNEDWGLFASGNYSYKDDVLNIPQNNLRLTNQNLVSGRVGVSRALSGGNEFSIWVWGENILDDKYTIDSLPFETFAYRTVVFGQPATYGLAAKIEF